MQKKPTIYLIACCFNEAALLPFFLDYYSHFVGVSKFILFDGGSTDATADLIKDYPVEFIVERSEKLDDRQLMYFRNEAYKSWRTECDWFIVCDIDEFLFHPSLQERLQYYKEQAITVPFVEGFEMYSKAFPQFKPGAFLPHRLQYGTPKPLYYNKHLIFDPAVDINYTLGCHGANPTGPVKYSDAFELKNFHYKLLSLDYVLAKAKASAQRLSEWNTSTGAGHHYEQLAKTTRQEFLAQFVQADHIFHPVNRELEEDLLAGFMVNFLVQQSHAPVGLEIGHDQRSSRPFSASLERVTRKLGGQRMRLDGGQVGLSWPAMARMASLSDYGPNWLYVEADLVRGLGVDVRDGLNAILSIYLGIGAAEGQLLILDFGSLSELDRSMLLSAETLLRHFELLRYEDFVLGSCQRI